MLVEESVADQRCQQCQGFILRLHDLAFLHFRRFGQVGYLVTVQTWQRTKSWRASCHFAIFPSLVNFDFCFILSLDPGLCILAHAAFEPGLCILGFGSWLMLPLNLAFRSWRILHSSGLWIPASFWLWSDPGFIFALHFVFEPSSFNVF